MKKVQFLFALMLISAGLSAQHSLVVFLDASEKKPFYVRLGDKTSASSSTGQVYITDLTEASQEILIGFPDQNSTEHRFRVNLDKAENNFQLKTSGQGWTLIDLESNKILQPLTTPAVSTGGGVRKTDAFSVMMAGVVNDSSVLYYTVVAPEPVKKAAPIVSKQDSGLAKTQPSAGISAMPDNALREKMHTIVSPDSTKARKIDSSLTKGAATPKKKSDSAVIAAANAAKEDSIRNAALAVLTPKTEPARGNEFVPEKESASVKVSLPAKDTASVTESTALAKPDTASVQKAPVKTVLKPDSASQSPAAITGSAPKIETVSKTAIASILKISEKRSDNQLNVQFLDKLADGRLDTINIIIPIEATAPPRKDGVYPKWDSNPRPLTDPAVTRRDSLAKVELARRADSVKNAEALRKFEATAAAQPAVSKATTPVFADVPVKTDSSGKTDSLRKADQPVVKTPSMVNSDCANFATEYDVDKLRVKMIAEVSADERVNSARKVFRTRCFTARQIRALSELFLNDEGKYKFLDAAYPFVSDSQEFKKLADLLKDEYYIKRFNAMIRS